eukprot:218155-Pleurochrysis_carterae.AAC.1
MQKRACRTIDGTRRKAAAAGVGALEQNPFERVELLRISFPPAVVPPDEAPAHAHVRLLMLHTNTPYDKDSPSQRLNHRLAPGSRQSEVFNNSKGRQGRKVETMRGMRKRSSGRRGVQPLYLVADFGDPVRRARRRRQPQPLLAQPLDQLAPRLVHKLVETNLRKAHATELGGVRGSIMAVRLDIAAWRKSCVGAAQRLTASHCSVASSDLITSVARAGLRPN